jgi:stage II sporulation protein E
MGCGHDARNDSEGMTGLLKEFILSGFDVETAIKTVNSALCMQIERERSASVDVLCIDRVNRTAKMYKIGCAETVIKKGDKFDTVLPLSLPAGIIDEINAQPQNRRVQKGDIFIMASDGVTQCGGVFGDWIQNEISEEMSAQDIANKIMNRAVTKWNGAAFDDLTVVAVRIE